MQNRGRQRRQAQAVVRGSVLDTKFPANRKRKAKPVGWQAFSILFAFLILVALLVCLIVWRQPADNPNSPGPAPTRTKPDMASSSVYDRGLVTKNVTYHSVLAVSAPQCDFVSTGVFVRWLLSIGETSLWYTINCTRGGCMYDGPTLN